ncbi:MAG: type II toxin-antitoxin system Phd/YefM family antitoxin [Candidatus Dormibacteraceae bacterium]
MAAVDETTIHQRVGVRELKARLSSYLDQVQRGYPVVVTEHGHPVAQLVPYERADKLSELITSRRAEGPRTHVRSLPDEVEGGGPLSDLVLEQRR